MATAIQKGALCYGQKLGHDFVTTGGKCSKCGIGQDELSSKLEKWSSAREIDNTHDTSIANQASVQSGTPPHRARIKKQDTGSVGRGIEYFLRKPEKGMHSEAHALAKEISEYCGEPKKFGMYLGIIKNMGLPRAYKIFAEIKQSKDVETPGKLFVYLSSTKQKADKMSAQSTPPLNKH